MTYSNKTYGGHKGGYNAGNSKPKQQPQQSQPSAAKKTADVVITPPPPAKSVNIWATLLSVLAVIVRVFPIKLEKAKKERTLVVVKVFGFEFSDVEWTDVLLGVMVVAAFGLIDQGLVVLGMKSVTIEYYLSTLGALLVLVTSVIFLDKHGFKYPVMLGVVISAFAGMYFDFTTSLSAGNSFTFVAGFVFGYKFVIEPIIEAIVRSRSTVTNSVSETIAAEAPVNQSTTQQEPAKRTLSQDEATKIVKRVITGAAANWNEHRNAIVATFTANYPGQQNILATLADQIKDWPEVSFDGLLEAFSITQQITYPEIPAPKTEKKEPKEPVVLDFLDLQYKTDQMLAKVTDWPSNVDQDFVDSRRDDLVGRVSTYAELLGQEPRSVMTTLLSEKSGEMKDWNGTWKGLLDTIDKLILNQKESTKPIETALNLTVQVPEETVALPLPPEEATSTIWQQVLEKCGWSQSDAAKKTFTSYILKPVCDQALWALHEDGEAFAKIWSIIKDEPNFSNPFNSRVEKDNANNATIEWLLGLIREQPVLA